MIILNENLYLSLSSRFVDSVELILLNDTTEYRFLRKLIAEANSISRSWLYEPDADVAISLKKNLINAWQKCHQWLLGEIKGKALWSPEWFGWLAYTSLYSPESPWQSFCYSFLLLDLCLERVPADFSGNSRESFLESLGRLASMISDESREPLFLTPLLETELLNNHSLREIKEDNQEQKVPDRSSSDTLKCLQSLSESLEKLPEHFNRFDRIIHLEKMKTVISDAVLVLNQCIPGSRSSDQETDQGTDQESSACHQLSDSTGDNGIPAGQSAPKVMDRDSARLTIQELLAFFRRTEPHSPVSWQLETALNWLDMSFPELLLKMTGEQQEIYQDISRRLGMIDTLSIGDKPDE